MEQHMERVELERLRQDATCIIIRVGLGDYELLGPNRNILVPESRVAWSTVANDLQGEGYRLVTPEEYGEETGTPADEVLALIHERGELFALTFRDETVVPLPHKEALLPPIET